MAFKLFRTLDGSSPPIEYYLMTDSEAVTLGEALVQTSGRLTKCGATTTPEFIALKTQALEASAVTEVPVHRVTELQEWKNTSNATLATTIVGNKVTLHTDGLVVTATTSSGVFLITYTDGATTTSNIRGIFRR